jgi:hypothetical protein
MSPAVSLYEPCWEFVGDAMDASLPTGRKAELEL